MANGPYSKGDKKIRVHESSDHYNTRSHSGHINQRDLREALIELLDDPELARALHLHSDLDFDDSSQHHRIGNQPHQAKSGF